MLSQIYLVHGYFACLQSSSSDLTLTKISFSLLCIVLLEILELCNVLLHERNPQYLKALNIFELFSKLLQNV